MWTLRSLIRSLALLALLLLSCSGCSAADWTITRTHAHPVAELRAQRRASNSPQVIVLSMPVPTPKATVSVEREPIPATVAPLLISPASPAVQEASTVTPRKRVQVLIEK